MTSARTFTYFIYILFLNNQINVLHILAYTVSMVLQFLCIYILLPSNQSIVSVLTTAHLVGYMKVMRVGTDD